MRTRWIALVALACLAVACSGSEPATRSTSEAVRVAVLPDQTEDRLRAQYDPLLDHLAGVAGLDLELLIPATYDELLARFADGEVDLAWFGGLTYLHADVDSGARPLAVRDVDLEFTSDFIASVEVPGEELGDFTHARFAFGPELSTSGHVMPLFHLGQHGLTPQTAFAETVHSTGHDETVLWVRDGVVDAGAVNSVVMESMLAEGIVSPDEIRIVSRTQPYRNYVWATRGDLDDEVRARLLDGFLSFDLTDDAHRAILERLGAGGFLPATASDFDGLRAAATDLGLLGGAGER